MNVALQPLSIEAPEGKVEEKSRPVLESKKTINFFHMRKNTLCWPFKIGRSITPEDF